MNLASNLVRKSAPMATRTIFNQTPQPQFNYNNLTNAAKYMDDTAGEIFKYGIGKSKFMDSSAKNTVTNLYNIGKTGLVTVPSAAKTGKEYFDKYNPNPFIKNDYLNQMPNSTDNIPSYIPINPYDGGRSKSRRRNLRRHKTRRLKSRRRK
jgi:hypothetical protein